MKLPKLTRPSLAFTGGAQFDIILNVLSNTENISNDGSQYRANV